MKDYKQALQSAWAERKGWVRENRLSAFCLYRDPSLVLEDYDSSFLGILRSAQWREALPALTEALHSLAEDIHPGAAPRFYWVENLPGKKAKLLGEDGETKVIREFDLRLEVRLGEGLHSGLFLDQRENRRLIRNLARGRKVLNLFCYTGAFTLAALAGGAKEVHSVDLSKNYLNWLKRNLDLNGVGEKKSFTHALDVFSFLRKAEKTEASYDLIILDPPTFSHGGGKVFSTEKRWTELLDSSLGRLNRRGKLLASLNTHGMDAKEFFERTRLVAKNHGMKILEKLALPEDQGLNPEERKNPPVKSCLIG